MRPILLLLPLLGCPTLDLDPVTAAPFVVYDPSGGAIPLPNDAARDDDAGTLALPVDDDLAPAERDLRTWLNTLDGWPTAYPVVFETSAPIDPASVAGNVEVWEWGAEPALAEVLGIAVDDDGLGLVVDPPREGWVHGGTYYVVVRGGPDGLRTTDGASFGPDAAFYYLRLDQPLSPGHGRAFPGATRDERAEAAAKLEGIRGELQPLFEHFGDALPRDEVAAAFKFTVTTRVEVAMDKASQRMPLPFDLLVDPETGLLNLEPAPWDDALEADAKLVANTLDGFAVSADPMFEFSGPVDPATLVGNVTLYDLAQTPVVVPATPVLYAESGTAPCETSPPADDCRYVLLELDDDHRPLKPGSVYAVAVGDGLTDLSGRPVVPMPIGALVRGDQPVLVDGKSQIGSLDAETAGRLETVRADADLLLDAIGRDDLVTAWPFTTMDRVQALRDTVAASETGAVAIEPVILDRMPPTDPFTEQDAISELFPGVLNPAPVAYLGRLDGVAEVVSGTLSMPSHLDPVTRRWVAEPTMRDVHFWATIPEGAGPGPLPVVIFGHAIVTDRRFLLLVAGELAKQGFAAVSIDFPYHGERIACVEASLVAVPNFLTSDLQNLTGLTDDLLWFPPCQSGAAASCAPTGECLDADGAIEPFSSFPIIDIQPACGAAFLDVQDLPHIPDHFNQALMDLGSLRWSLQSQDWTPVFGGPIVTDRFRYAGMSLGSIIGADYVLADPNIDRAVLNVPGANMVELFQDSQFFGPQMDAYLADLGVAEGSWEHRRLLNVARLLIDAVDPHTVAHAYRDDGRPVLIQYDKVNDTLGDIVIPNHTTETLIRVSGLEAVTYPSVIHGDLVVPLVGDPMLRDLADYLGQP